MSLQWLSWIGVLAAVVGGLLVLGRLMAKGEAQTQKLRAKKALEVLETRRTKGEINGDDYERQKRQLETRLSA